MVRHRSCRPVRQCLHRWRRRDRSHLVGITGLGPAEADESLHLRLDLHDAGQLAGLVELLADATPDQHRELAAAIRMAAADITNEAGEQQ